MLRIATLAGAALTLALPTSVLAQEVNVYSSRHYDTDQAIYDAFTAETGIRVNIIEASGDEILARIQAEGANSPADVLVTVDGGRLHRAVEAGLLAPVDSAVLEARVPAELQHPDNLWFGLTTRARVIFYNLEAGLPAGVDDYEDLADPANLGTVCMRSSQNIYSVSLLAEFIETMGEDAALAWAQGLNANLARPPQGGDTDQLKALAAGECTLAVSNTYYWGRLMASSNPEDVAVAQRIAFIFPNQDDRGTHVNISGAGVLTTAPNRENAIRFLEYMVSDAAQQVLADSNNEYPAVPGVTITGPIGAFTEFRSSGVNVSVYGANQARAVAMWETVGMP